MLPTESKPRRQLPYLVEVVAAVAAIVVFLLMGYYFFTTASRTSTFIEGLLEQIHADTSAAHNEIVCILQAPVEERTDELVQSCRNSASGS